MPSVLRNGHAILIGPNLLLFGHAPTAVLWNLIQTFITRDLLSRDGHCTRAAIYQTCLARGGTRRCRSAAPVFQFEGHLMPGRRCPRLDRATIWNCTKQCSCKIVSMNCAFFPIAGQLCTRALAFYRWKGAALTEIVRCNSTFWITAQTANTDACSDGSFVVVVRRISNRWMVFKRVSFFTIRFLLQH